MAYAAVTSLFQTLKSLSERPPVIHLHKKQVESLYDGIHFLQAFLEDIAKDGRDHWMVKVKSLERRIRNFAYKAEDTIESHVFNSYLAEQKQEQEKDCLIIHKSFRSIIEEVDSIKEEVRKIYDQITGVGILQSASSSVKDLSRKALVPVAQTSRRLSFHSGISGHPDDHSFSRPSIPFTRSFFIWGRHRQYHYTSNVKSLFNHIEFKLLRVLDITFTHFYYFPMELVLLVHLRYLALITLCNLPTSISKLQNLQTLILDASFKTSTFQKEIWNLPKLRHIHSKAGCYLPDPPKADSEREISLILQNLQTISRLSLSSCTENVFTSIPNLTKLCINETKHDYHSRAELSIFLTNLASLQQLEKLKIHFNSGNQQLRWIPSLYAFAPRLKKLTLAWTYLPWDYMGILGMLPNLEVLKLRNYAFKGKQWELIEEGFFKLRVLQLHCLDLVQWNANKFHFPSLQKLVLWFCFHLKEIPLGIGDIDTLEIIELDDSSPSAVKSAMQIQEQQKCQGNDELEVHIYHA
ncbi:hypothetical protein ACH5RR_029788 [Cinchona calisaya]|uniref:Disease resistance R13L4/SHOC-2-like LRR domain-containing protein n=1 Tax=Cinchona calisaya TaxID=153742 RepID=A0ABD2YSR1_9GENT